MINYVGYLQLIDPDYYFNELAINSPHSLVGDNINSNFLNIILSFFIGYSLLAGAEDEKIQLPRQEKELRVLLEELRGNEGLNFIYSDQLVEGILIQDLPHTKPSTEHLRSFLERYGLTFKLYGNNTYVLYKKKAETAESNIEAFVTKEEIPDPDSLQINIKPIQLNSPSPVYPRKAVKQGIEGSVRVKFLVNEKGFVTDSEVMATSGHHVLDSAARAFVYNLKYRPGESDGKPQSTWMSMLFRYILSGKQVDNE